MRAGQSWASGVLKRVESKGMLGAAVTVETHLHIALGGLRKRGAAGDGISLLGKWLGSPAGHYDKATGMATLLAMRLFPSMKAPKKQYRQLCSRLRANLRVVEVVMT